MDIRQSLWTSACGIEHELCEHATPIARPSPALESRFNGGVAPPVAQHYSAILTMGYLTENARILDLGCGFGRIAMGLAQRLGPGQRYYGLDPNAEGIDWAQGNITPIYPNFSFERIDVHSQPYNPAGTVTGSNFRFPFADGSLDLVFMISVLTHVDLPTVETYFREAARTLNPETGRLVTTIFLLDDEVERLLAAGQSRFKLAWPHGRSRIENPANPELVIAHPRDDVLEILRNAGFEQVTTVPGHWSGRQSQSPQDFQDLLIADRRAGALVQLPSEWRVPQDLFDAADQEFCDRIASLVDGNPRRQSRFMTWANAIALNAFWWQYEGLTLGLADDPAGDRWHLGFDKLVPLGISDVRPDGWMADGRFHQFDDGQMIALLIKNGRVIGRHTMMAALVESARNGLMILDAMRAGHRLMLHSAGNAPVPAPIPAFDAGHA